jgi:hypothetical protein
MLGQGAPQSLALGQLGADFIYDTSAHTGEWGRIHAVPTAGGNVAALFSALESSTLVPHSGGVLTQLALNPGDEVQGRFTSITLFQGAVIAYRL